MQRYLLESAQAARHFIGFNVGEAFALATTLSLVFANPRRRVPLNGSDITILLFSAIVWFIPHERGVYLSTTLAGLWFLFGSRSDHHLKGIGQIWLALSICELWGKIVFWLFYHVIEEFEVSFIYRVGQAYYNEIGITGANLSIRDDWSVVVLEGCSSFHNLSQTVLIWLSILKIANKPACSAAFRALGVSACLVVTINVTRILAMLPSHEAYFFWHDGSGSTLVALSSLAAAIVPILISVERSACRLSPRL
ncbi:hypothetical protein [Methylobacterium longum]|uniref:Exosortase/archaeosortase family protein n=1 Tax=Methylobacterium longum TaxID=767694 RepID=A0ABT8AR01_9HYPH|nr:hypothetical protein [Methylobacterium longum]MDN3571784.1 hypothetical protein [Methylobacterium longum]